jgi:hypothetical protein
MLAMRSHLVEPHIDTITPNGAQVKISAEYGRFSVEYIVRRGIIALETWLNQIPQCDFDPAIANIVWSG